MAKNSIFYWASAVTLPVLAGFTANAFANPVSLLKLHENEEVVQKVNQYLSGDPECNSCRGNNRSSGVEKLEFVAEENGNETKYFLTGTIWANTWHRIKVKDNRGTQLALAAFGLDFPENSKLTVYGGPHCEQDTNSSDETRRDCGYLSIQFNLALDKALSQWIIHQTSNNGQQIVVEKNLAPALVNAALAPIFPQHPTGPARVEISAQKIFEIARPNLPELLSDEIFTSRTSIENRDTLDIVHPTSPFEQT